ncbi:unnamed protein product, partial [Onchocerca flexuosa]|uniref:Forty-two-three domain-containing protein 1 n=1 Tax=Onchocerca flexuosa TaxID=387005 RepID=A0A183HD58_9BILA
MDNSIVDNKLNMSLDDIIKKERKAKQRQQNGGIQGIAGKRMVPKRMNRGKRSIAVRSITRRNRQQTAVNGGLSAAVTMKVVNRLVKKAIRRRANQSLINRAVTLRRRALRQNSAVRPAVCSAAIPIFIWAANEKRRFQMRGLRARRQAAVIGSRLMGRLSGVSQRSQVIRRNAGRNARGQPVIFTSPQTVRGRGLSHMGQLASDSEAFMVEQHEIARPTFQQKVLRREIIAAQPRREVIMQRRTRPVIVEQQPIIIRRGGIRKRAILNESDVVVVGNAPRQAQFRTRPEFGRMQRVVSVRPRNRIIRKKQYVNPNAAQMREALGIGLRRVSSQVMIDTF